METIPLFLLPICIVAIGAIYAFNRRRIDRTERQYARFRAGVIAERLRMRMVEGDPHFNLFVGQANADVRRGPNDGKPVHIEIRMQGEPHGVPLELVYRHRVGQKTGYSPAKWTKWFDCRMIAHTSQPFPAFEVTSRWTPFGSILQTQTLPDMPTGDPAVDSKYLVTTSEPALAQLLGQVLPGFVQFARTGVHLVGDGRTIAFVMHQHRSPLVALGLHHAETMANLLSELARRVGG